MNSEINNNNNMNHVKINNGFPNIDFITSTVQKNLTDQKLNVASIKPLYIKYKPKTSCVIAYKAEISDDDSSNNTELLLYAKVFSKHEFQNGIDKASPHRWIKLEMTPSYVIIPDANIILYFFPNDCVIDGLRILSDKKKIQRDLYEYYQRYNPGEWRISDKKLNITVVRYKPERRVVIQCNSKAVNKKTNIKEPLEIYFRIYSDNLGEYVFSVQSDVYKQLQENKILSTPMPIGYNRERKIMYLEKVPGDVLSSLLLSEVSHEAVIKKAAHALSELHKLETSTLNNLNPENLFSEIDAMASYLSNILPESANLIHSILSKLKDHNEFSNYEELCFLHGDCHPGQFIIDENIVSLIDFDRAIAGNRLIDISNFIATQKYSQLIGEIENSENYENYFKESYIDYSEVKINDNELNHWISYNLFKLAVKPFREFRDNWQEISTRIMKECLKLLT